MSHVPADRRYGQLVRQLDGNGFIVGVSTVEDFPDEEAFGGRVTLFYPKGVLERTGDGGYAFWSSFRNPRYMDMVQEEVASDARRFYTSRRFPVVWTPRAEKLKKKREKGKYLPEKKWTLGQAKKEVLEDFQLWKLDPNVQTLSERETAEYIIREGMGSTKAEKFLAEARRGGLETLRTQYERDSLNNLLSGIQQIRSPVSHRETSRFREEMDNARHDIERYARVCSELGVQPADFDFVKRLLALRRAGVKNVDFQDVAEVLVSALRNLGKDGMKDYRGFDVKISRKKAKVTSTTFIKGEKVEA